jgi:uncharacterized integral membrane protein (TIGR00697 family)
MIEARSDSPGRGRAALTVQVDQVTMGGMSESVEHPAPADWRPGAFTFMAAVFAGCLVGSAVLAVKLVHLFGLVFPAGVLAYAVTFACTDVISEIWGKRRARQVVWAGFFALVIFYGLAWLAIVLPPAGFWKGQPAFANVLGSTLRIIIASLIAYLVSQLSDLILFHRIRLKTRGKWLWLRNTGSTMVSQAIDTVLFISIAFSFEITFGQVVGLIVGQYIIKLAIAVADTPLVYAAVWMIRRPKNEI